MPIQDMNHEHKFVNERTHKISENHVVEGGGGGGGGGGGEE